jgi:hypothetical protein
MDLTVRKLQSFGPRAYAGQAIPVGTRGECARIQAEDVVALGRFGSHGDAVSRLLVRVASGERYQIMAADQTAEGARWLRKRSKAFKGYPHTSREIGWSEVWDDTHGIVNALVRPRASEEAR